MGSIAFIMSVYAGDHAEWVDQAIESILAQQCVEPLEIRLYVCIDGPVDHSVSDCIDGWRDKLHRVLVNETARGLTFSLNRMIRALDDELFVFRMDADDVCAPDRVQKQLSFMSQHPDVLICGGAIEEFSESPEKRSGFVRTYPADTPSMRRYIVKASPFAHPAVCFRRTFFERVGLYNEAFPMRQDIELWFRAIEQNIPMANLAEPVLWFRVSEKLVSRRNAKLGRLEFRIFTAGIYRLYGIHPALIYPFVRLLVRMLPVFLTRIVYRSGIRNILNSSQRS